MREAAREETNGAADEEVLAQHAALRETAALLDPRDRRVLDVVGERALEMIQRLVTNTTEPVRTGRGVYAYALTAKGRPVAELRVLPRPAPRDAGPSEAGCWLDTPVACVDALRSYLAKYMPPRLASVSPTDRVRLSVVGPRALDALAAAPGPDPLSLPAPNDLRGLAPLETRAVRLRDGGAGLVARREPIEGDGFDLYVPEAIADAARAALRAGVEARGGRAAGPEAFEIFRVERGLPVYGREIGDDNLPQETGQAGRAVDFEKGCYTGQEVVARIHYRGHVNRLLRGLRATGEELPSEPGHRLFAEGRPVGELRTSVRSPRHGSIGLGYVRREVEPGATLATREDGPATVEVVELPFTST